jgi:hypothetical protein
MIVISWSCFSLLCDTTSLHKTGWSPVLKLMQGIYSLFASWFSYIFILLVVLAVTVPLHYNHLFIWMDESLKSDKLVQQNQAIERSFWLIRQQYFLIGWNLYRFYSEKLFWHKTSRMTILLQKNFKLSAAF